MSVPNVTLCDPVHILSVVVLDVGVFVAVEGVF